MLKIERPSFEVFADYLAHALVANYSATVGRTGSGTFSIPNGAPRTRIEVVGFDGQLLQSACTMVQRAEALAVVTERDPRELIATALAAALCPTGTREWELIEALTVNLTGLFVRRASAFDRHASLPVQEEVI